MRIIKVDNYGRESVADVLIADNVHPDYAQLLVDSLNIDRRSNEYFKVKPEDYRLWRGMEELV